MSSSDASKGSPFLGKRLAGNRNLAYASIHPFPLPGWQPAELLRIKGKSWQVVFKPDGVEYPEIERGGKVIIRHLEGPNVLIGGTNGLSDPAEVISTQKPLIDAVRGLLLLFGPPAKPILLPPIWEGVLRKTSSETIAYEVGRLEATGLNLTKAQLEAWGSEWQNFNPLAIPPEVGFALRWFYKGMLELCNLSEERTEAFTALWLCVITLVRAWYSQHSKGDPSEMERFIAYADQRLKLLGTDLENTKEEFQQIKERRNELFKGGGGMAVSETEATTAANLAHRILRFEVSLYAKVEGEGKSS